jgi:hypothetical protein
MENLENLKELLAFLLFILGSICSLFDKDAKGALLISVSIYLLVS